MIAQSNYNLLRWLLRRGSPLPIPNRVVKPACADGTAVMWESMSSPFFNLNSFQILNPHHLFDEDFFVVCPAWAITLGCKSRTRLYSGKC